MLTESESVMNVADAQAECLSRNIPFFSYRLPGQNEVCFGARLDGLVEEFQGLPVDSGKLGFVVAPFERTLPVLFICPDLYFKDSLCDKGLAERLKGTFFENKERSYMGRDSDRESYIRQVKEMIRLLKEKKAHKMVLARSLFIPCDAYGNAVRWFGNIEKSYPDAFVFWVSVPGVMNWMGASPEIFMRQDSSCFMTMALAGTQSSDRPIEEIIWEEKEVEEQLIVSNYIQDILRHDKNADWKITGPFSRSAGKVIHLCTIFESKARLTVDDLEWLRKELHPTPAVGGFPKREALERMAEIEECDRRYYAGYLGPIQKDGTLDWYVNLRSMEIFPSAVRLYVGGGITALSDPDKEWEETELKSRTLLNLIS